jgi:Zn-dependent protease with chaperone function
MLVRSFAALIESPKDPLDSYACLAVRRYVLAYFSAVSFVVAVLLLTGTASYLYASASAHAAASAFIIVATFAAGHFTLVVLALIARGIMCRINIFPAVRYQEHVELQKVWRRIARGTAHVNTPVLLSDQLQVNAHIGRQSGRFAATVSRGLWERTPVEIAAALAHELGHLLVPVGMRGLSIVQCILHPVGVVIRLMSYLAKGDASSAPTRALTSKSDIDRGGRLWRVIRFFWRFTPEYLGQLNEFAADAIAVQRLGRVAPLVFTLEEQRYDFCGMDIDRDHDPFSAVHPRIGERVEVLLALSARS